MSLFIKRLGLVAEIIHLHIWKILTVSPIFSYFSELPVVAAETMVATSVAAAIIATAAAAIRAGRAGAERVVTLEVTLAVTLEVVVPP